MLTKDAEAAHIDGHVFPQLELVEVLEPRRTQDPEADVAAGVIEVPVQGVVVMPVEVVVPVAISNTSAALSFSAALVAVLVAPLVPSEFRLRAQYE